MPDWISEHIGEIALLIYIVYPLLKRWWDRRRQRREQKRSHEQHQAQRQEQPRGREQRAQKRVERRPPVPRRRSEQPSQAPPRQEQPKEAAYLQAARDRLDRLKKETSGLLLKAQADPRLARLVPALREDLLGRIETIERSLAGSPTISTIVQETTIIQGLEELFGFLTAMARQRRRGGSAYLADADGIADACYAPLLQLATAQSLGLRTNLPVSVAGDWSLSIVPRFASTRVAPIRIPAGFEDSLWHWPAIAHEVAHDFYYSQENIARDLRARLGLPRRVEVPMSEMQLDGAWLRGVYGAWLPEVFADVVGTLMLGPAYVETMIRAFRGPGSPERTAAIFQDGGFIDEHPPERLRVYIATRVLHHLGRHDAGDALWDRWETEHPDVRFYYLPLGGDWVGLSDANLHAVSDSIVDVLLQRPWPELDGFPLLNIPGLAYLHAEHAAVERLQQRLAEGEIVDADARWITAAAVLAAAAQPTLHDRILDAARRSVRGFGETLAPTARPLEPRAMKRTVGAALVASLRHPKAIEEAVVLGAVLTPRRRPNWR